MVAREGISEVSSHVWSEIDLVRLVDGLCSRLLTRVSFGGLRPRSLDSQCRRSSLAGWEAEHERGGDEKG